LGAPLAAATGVRDRRRRGARLALARRIMHEVFARPWFMPDAVDTRRLFGVTPEICRRILLELERAGAVRQVRPGAWMRPVS
jgi:hypothetical protein